MELARIVRREDRGYVRLTRLRLSWRQALAAGGREARMADAMERAARHGNHGAPGRPGDGTCDEDPLGTRAQDHGHGRGPRRGWQRHHPLLRVAGTGTRGPLETGLRPRGREDPDEPAPGHA